jgi:hypothetical protein
VKAGSGALRVVLGDVLVAPVVVVGVVARGVVLVVVEGGAVVCVAGGEPATDTVLV